MMKKFVRVLFIIPVLAVLCGCKDGTNGSSSVDNKKTEPTYGQSVIVGVTQDPDSLDPHKALAAGTNEILFNIFEGLVKPDKDGNFKEAVAKSYEISEDASVYTFVLRDNVKFHNGKTVTVQDVIYSIKRCAGLLDENDPSVKTETALSVISSIESTDEQTIVIKLSKPNTELLCYLTCAIIPCDYDKQETFPIGTGPFKFVSFSPMSALVMERNEDYYGEKAYLDKVTFKIYGSADAAFLELLAGKLDIFPYLTDEQAMQLQRDYDILNATTNMVQALYLNNAEEPFNNEKVRQALCYSINRKEIVDMVSGGKGKVIGSSMYPGLTSFYDDSLEDYYSFDINKAKRLLLEAGYPAGFDMTITVPSNYQIHMDTAQIIVEQLKKVGIKAKIEPVEWSTWLTDVYSGRKYQSTIIAVDGNLAPNDIMKRFVSDAGNNFVNFNVSEFDAYFLNAFGTVQMSEKVELYKKAEKELTSHAASVFIMSPAVLTAVKKDVHGYEIYPVYVQDLSTVYKSK